MLYKLKVYDLVSNKVIDVKRIFASGQRIAVKKYIRKYRPEFKKAGVLVMNEKSKRVYEYALEKSFNGSETIIDLKRVGK